MTRWRVGCRAILALLLMSWLITVNADVYELGHGRIARQVTVPPPDEPTTAQPTPPETTTTITTPTTEDTPPESTTTTPDPPTTTAAPPEPTTTPDQPTTEQPAPETTNTQPSVVISTGAGSEVVETQTNTLSSSSAASPSATSEDSNSDDDEGGGGVSTGSIIGMSVAGGIAILGIAGFFFWKFTRKRFHDFDDNEAIKWPELNTHNAGNASADTHALPVHNTGRAGFGDENDLDSRAPSTTGNYSTTDFSHDPYQVAPMPAYNPNVPYMDDPTTSGAMYDPYRGPVPQSFGDPAHPGDAIPMTQMRSTSPGPGRALSPNPAAMYNGPPGSNPYGPDRVMSPNIPGGGYAR